MRAFVGLCGRCPDGFESSGRGESRWAQSLARCLSSCGVEVFMAPDVEEASWGRCQKPDNVHLLQAHEKSNLYSTYFDVAIFTSWLTEREEAKFIHAGKYVWGIMGWKDGVMVDGYFKDNEYIARWTRQDLLSSPENINFRDRCILIAQPFGKNFGESKFQNKRIAWVAKEAFLPVVNSLYNESAYRHLLGVIEACKKTGAGLSIFSSYELDPKNNKVSKELGIMDKIGELDDVILYPALPFKEYQEELFKCSVTMPLMFAGSIPESIFNGLVPFLYKDNMFANHPWIKGVTEGLTNNAISYGEKDSNYMLNPDEICNILCRLLTDKNYFDEYLCRLWPMVYESLDSNVIYAIDKLVSLNITGKDVRI
jgi:hypothetical protein